jgi:hypothetical protein
MSRGGADPEQAAPDSINPTPHEAMDPLLRLITAPHVNAILE